MRMSSRAAKRRQGAVPAAHANYGDIYNLSIARGTLTAEERFKITDHAIQTILRITFRTIRVPPRRWMHA